MIDKPKNALEFKRINFIRTRNAILKAIKEKRIKTVEVSLPKIQK